MEPTKVIKYDCGRSGCVWHDTKEEAEACRKGFGEVELWVCPHCSQKWFREEAAKRCCEGENNG
jgi:hypothetical protein